jgi:FKBP-type peptidyl-prolyl cis-trans isomerase FkpA
MLKKLSAILLAATVVVGCNNRVEVRNGVKLQIHKHDGSAKKLKEGDVVTFQVIIKTPKDSVLQDSQKSGQPARMMVPAPGKGAFKGSFEDGISQLSVGDSATIFVPIDSLTKGGVVPPFLKKGTDLKYVVKIVKSQTRAEAEKDAKAEQDKAMADAKGRAALVPKMIDDYVAKSGKAFQTTASGLKYNMASAGSGVSPAMGDVAKCMYVGKFLDGKVFDKSNAPTDMPIGQMIPGFNEGLMLMKKGGKATFVIPPSIGYGEASQGPIPGNSPLVFEVELIDFTKGQAGPPQGPPQQ